jgi:hypothetical protein
MVVAMLLSSGTDNARFSGISIELVRLNLTWLT